jgi:hypothetical protein
MRRRPGGRRHGLRRRSERGLALIPVSVEDVTAVHVPEQLSPAIARPRHHVEAVLAQSLREVGINGRAALAWQWALTGTRPSPVTLSLAPGRPPSREEILGEAAAEPEGSTAPPGAPSEFYDQLRETRAILAWLAGGSDEIPVDGDNRGRLIGARGDYARTDGDIREALDHALLGLKTFDLPEPIPPSDAKHPWRWNAAWMNAAWLRGVRDILTWVLGQTPTSPLCQRTIGLPTTYDLTHERAAADDVVLQGRPGGHPVDPAAYPPPQYGEGIQAAIAWLRGETTTPPTDYKGHSPYSVDH